MKIILLFPLNKLENSTLSLSKKKLTSKPTYLLTIILVLKKKSIHEFQIKTSVTKFIYLQNKCVKLKINQNINQM